MRPDERPHATPVPGGRRRRNGRPTAIDGDAAPAVRRLGDEADIRAVLVCDARGVEADIVRSCYRADATDAHGSYNGDVEGFLAYSLRCAGAVPANAHVLGQSGPRDAPHDDPRNRSRQVGPGCVACDGRSDNLRAH